jgi:two-component system sensor histidine kinase HydH
LDNIVMRFLQLAGPSVLTTKPLSVNTIVSHTCELLRPQAQERGIELAIVLADGLPQIEADADQLTQAFINLIINGLQAAPTGGHVRVHTVVTGTAALAVEVSDDGPGIPAENQDKIFEPYFTTKLDGSGLGLWITQQIVLAHGGTLRVQSEPGRGATFVVALPVRSKHG